MYLPFGDFVREKRLTKGLSLRQFAGMVGMQPSNYCNVENGGSPPPASEVLERIANALGLAKDSPDYRQLLDLAAKGRDEVPADIARMVKESDLIPALLRTVENEKVSENQLRGIIGDLSGGNSAVMETAQLARRLTRLPQARRRAILDSAEFIESSHKAKDADFDSDWDVELDRRVCEIEEGRATGRPAAALVRDMRAKYGETRRHP